MKIIYEESTAVSTGKLNGLRAGVPTDEVSGYTDMSIVAEGTVR